MSQTPLIPEWLAHDPSLTPGALSRSRSVGARVSLDSFEDSLHDGPTLPPAQARTKRPAVPVSVQAANAAQQAFLPPPRIAVVDEPAPDDWVLVAVGVGLTASMLTLLMMLISGYGAV